MKLTRQAVVLAAIAVCLSSPSVHSWGPEGHHIVAKIALGRLTPEAKKATQDLLGTEDFVAVSTWADEIRSQRPETYNWHFVDIPYDQLNYLATRDCKPTPQGDCILAELDRARHDLTDAALPKEKRAEALKWIIHLMGDVHQPLHCIDNHDRGGNDVFVSLVGQPPPPPGVRVNLHGVWDTRLIAMQTLDENAYVQTLAAEFQSTAIAGVPIDFTAWAESTHQIAVEYAYVYPGFSPGAPPPATQLVPLDKEYQDKARLAVDHQLELAGVRLASVLNSAFRNLR
ncbi:MAG: S1/P1 nuclease [Vicinamibacterales bacterium]